MLEDGTPYEHFQGFRWLYIGFKQLEIQWKPGAVRSEIVYHKQKTKLFWTQATKLLLEMACLYSERLSLCKTWKYECSKTCSKKGTPKCRLQVLLH